MKNIFATGLSFLVLAGVAWGQEPPVASAPARGSTGAVSAQKTGSGLPLPDDVPLLDDAVLNATPAPPPIWGGAEYLFWWVKGQHLSTPLVTTSTNLGATDAAGNNVAGGLGQPGTIILVGPGASYGPLSGGRFTLGGWLDREGTIGVEARGFFLGTSSFHRTESSGPAGSPLIGLPITDVSGLSGGGQNAIVESFPGTFAGGDTVISHSRLWGAEANGIVNIRRTSTWSLDVIAGFRYLDLREDLSVIGQSSNLVPVAAGGGVAFLNNFFDGTVTSTDRFNTSNHFYGGQLGARVNKQFGSAFVNLTAKVALGSTHQVSDILGYSTLQTISGTTAATLGGTYAVASNIGQRTSDQFSVVPEVDFKIGYNFTPRIRTFVGYNFMYWSRVARPGEQIDPRVDVRQVPTVPGFDGAAHSFPSPVLRNSDFWAQGITAGLEFRY
jgi:hypothetical protein